MPRRDLLDDAASHHFVSNFASGPLADGTVFGLLAGHRHHLAGLFGSDPAPPAGARDIPEPVLHREISQRDHLQGQPAFAPGTHRLHADAKLARNLAIVLAGIGLQDNAPLSGPSVGWCYGDALSALKRCARLRLSSMGRVSGVA